MAKKSYALKQLLPEEKPETGTKYLVRKPTKGLKVAEKMRVKKYDPVLKSHVWFIEKKMPPHSK
jgi:large subunit ribosomal protein L33